MRRFRLVSPSLALLALAALAGGCAGPNLAAAKRDRPLQISSDVAYGEGSFEGVKGLKLHEASWRPNDREPRATVILLHGLKDHADRYAGFAERLVREGYAVHALDLRGHALSEGERVWVDEFDDYVKDLTTFVDRVREKEPGKPLFLFGHSMGGAISTLYAMERKAGELDGLILSAAALKPGENASAFLIGISGILSTLTPGARAFEVDESVFSRDPEVIAEMRRDPLIHQENGPVRTGAELLGAMERIQENAEKLTVPLLALHGTADVSTTPEGSKQLVERARSKDKTLKLYDGLVHDLLHEPEKAQVIADIVAWLDARAPAAPAQQPDAGAQEEQPTTQGTAVE